MPSLSMANSLIFAILYREMANSCIHPSFEFQPDEVPRKVVGIADDFESQTRIPRHRHRKSQLVYASSGVLTVTTEMGSWVVPPQRAVWVPGGTDHAIRMSGRVRMRTLYLEPDAIGGALDRCSVVTISPLLREIIVRIVAMQVAHPLGSPEERLIEVLLDELRSVEQTPLCLPTPADPRLRLVTDRLVAHPGETRGLREWARVAGASPRTLDRLFRRETDMSFTTWRQQLRLLRALEMLAANEPVTVVALALGYESTSAFIAMFRRCLGQTPGRYFGTSESR